MTDRKPLTEDQLDDIENRAAHLTEYGTLDDEPLQEDLDRLTGIEVPALLAEIRRLRAELSGSRGQAIAWAADAIDAKLAVEPDHNRASALYELLLHLRDELPCTCARTGGLHAKGCRKYVPGHELISRHNALAVYRRERTAVESHVVADDSSDPEHIDDCPGCPAP
ncbi:hypothetical protein [Streptomyces sp. NPDC051997]|uniref:hypothetical protein n=1 Tax=Streptomyces sp. NPDC051997 TaxID=3155611 RepID=UPI00342D33C1